MTFDELLNIVSALAEVESRNEEEMMTTRRDRTTTTSIADE